MVIQSKNKLLNYSNGSIINDKNFHRFLRHKAFEFGKVEKGQFSDVEEDDSCDIDWSIFPDCFISNDFDKNDEVCSDVQKNTNLANDVSMESLHNFLSTPPLGCVMHETSDLVTLINTNSLMPNNISSSSQIVELSNQSSHENNSVYAPLSNAFGSKEIYVNGIVAKMDMATISALQYIETLDSEPTLVINFSDSIESLNENSQSFLSQISYFSSTNYSMNSRNDNEMIQNEIELSSQTFCSINQSQHENTPVYASLSNALSSKEIDVDGMTSKMNATTSCVLHDIETMHIEPSVAINILDSIESSNENSESCASQTSEFSSTNDSMNSRHSSNLKKRGRRMGTKTDKSLTTRIFGTIKKCVKSNEYRKNRERNSDAVRKHRKIKPNSKMLTCKYCNGVYLERGLLKHTNKNPYCIMIQQKLRN